MLNPNLQKLIARLRGTPQPTRGEVATAYKELIELALTLDQPVTQALYVMDGIISLLVASDDVGHDIKVYAEVIDEVKQRMLK